MKIKSPPQVIDSMHKTSPDIVRHIQAVTDDVRGILSGGLSFTDQQLPFQVRSVLVTSGQPVYLNMQGPFSTIGCIPIQTNGAVIISTSSNQSAGKFNITLTMDVTTSQIIFLMVGTSL